MQLIDVDEFDTARVARRLRVRCPQPRAERVVS